jgi:hypothetical protein
MSCIVLKFHFSQVRRIMAIDPFSEKDRALNGFHAVGLSSPDVEELHVPEL